MERATEFILKALIKREKIMRLINWLPIIVIAEAIIFLSFVVAGFVTLINGWG
jgi:hypothetical protein